MSFPCYRAFKRPPISTEKSPKSLGWHAKSSKIWVKFTLPPYLSFYTAQCNPTGLVTLLQRCPKFFHDFDLLCLKCLFSQPWGYIQTSFHAQLCRTKHPQRLITFIPACSPFILYGYLVLHLFSSAVPPTSLTVQMLSWIFLYPQCHIHRVAHKGHLVFLLLLRIYQKCRLHWQKHTLHLVIWSGNSFTLTLINPNKVRGHQNDDLLSSFASSGKTVLSHFRSEEKFLVVATLVSWRRDL